MKQEYSVDLGADSSFPKKKHEPETFCMIKNFLSHVYSRIYYVQEKKKKMTDSHGENYLRDNSLSMVHRLAPPKLRSVRDYHIYRAHNLVYEFTHE